MQAAMRWVAPLVLLIAADAAASPCEVAIARAPDDVRIEIESWVRAEPRCATPLEIRVVPTEGGYYLFAREPNGRVRERIVPDAQSAGVLVASWVADDAAPGTASVVVEIVAPAEIVIDAPGSASPIVVDRLVTKGERSRRATRWLTLGGMLRVEGGGGGGLRGELDVKSFGAWSLGAAVSGSRSFSEALGIGFDGTWTWAGLEARDLRAIAQIARTSRFGAWELRIGAGLGVVYTSAHGYSSSSIDEFTAQGVSPTGELAVQLSRRLGDHWAITAGPLATWYQQELDASTWVDDTAIGGPMLVPVQIERQQVERSLFAGLRHEL